MRGIQAVASQIVALLTRSCHDRLENMAERRARRSADFHRSVVKIV